MHNIIYRTEKTCLALLSIQIEYKKEHKAKHIHNQKKTHKQQGSVSIASIYHVRSAHPFSVLLAILLFKTIKFAINSNFLFVNRSKRDFHGKTEEIGKSIDKKINFMSTSLDSKRYYCWWLFQIEYAIWLDKFPAEPNLQPTAVKPFFLRQINFQLNQSDRENEKNLYPFVINSNFPDDMIFERVGIFYVQPY